MLAPAAVLAVGVDAGAGAGAGLAAGLIRRVRFLAFLPRGTRAAVPVRVRVRVYVRVWMVGYTTDVRACVWQFEHHTHIHIHTHAHAHTQLHELAEAQTKMNDCYEFAAESSS